jgi:hypothetical protein
VRFEADAGVTEGVIGVFEEVGGGGGGGVDGVAFVPERSGMFVDVLSEFSVVVVGAFGGRLHGRPVLIPGGVRDGAAPGFVSATEVGIRSCEGSDSVGGLAVELEVSLAGLTRGRLVARGLGALADPLRLLFALEGPSVFPLTGLALRPLALVLEAPPPLPLYRLFPARPVPNLFANSWDAGMGGG